MSFLIILEHVEKMEGKVEKFKKVELFILEVVTIVTIQITDGTSWLGKDLKLNRSFGQIYVLLLKKRACRRLIRQARYDYASSTVHCVF